MTTAQAPSPPLAAPDHVRFAALGDVGKGDDAQARVADSLREVCAAEGCDFVLLLGDNLYPRGLASDADPRADRIIAEPYRGIAPLYLVLGNHDWDTADAVVAERQIEWAAGQTDLHLPAHAWWFDAGPARFVGVDTNAVFQRGASFQAAWTRDRLDQAETAWTVVAGHHPYRSDGPHGNAGAYEGWRWVPWVSGAAVERFYEDAVCGRADLALAGHDHTRQLLSACGTALVVAGTGASATRIVDRGNDPAFADTELGFLWTELGPERGELRFYGVAGRLDASFPLEPARGDAYQSPDAPP